MKKRILSLALAVVMMLGMLGNITAYADEKLSLIELTDEYVVCEDGKIIDLSIQAYSARRSDMHSKTHWWGRKHTFCTDDAARDYAYSVADTVDYNANKSGEGIILEARWTLTYKCYPRT